MTREYDREYEFDYGFWGMHPYVLACGEKAFELLGEHFGVDSSTLSDIEDDAKWDVLSALAEAESRGKNPFYDSKPFMLANLINQCKLDHLIVHICRTQRLNEDDFEHDAYNDGVLVDVRYKGEVIA